jgi:hypothetical protein
VELRDESRVEVVGQVLGVHLMESKSHNRRSLKSVRRVHDFSYAYAILQLGDGHIP